MSNYIRIYAARKGVSTYEIKIGDGTVKASFHDSKKLAKLLKICNITNKLELKDSDDTVLMLKPVECEIEINLDQKSIKIFYQVQQSRISTVVNTKYANSINQAQKVEAKLLKLLKGEALLLHTDNYNKSFDFVKKGCYVLILLGIVVGVFAYFKRFSFNIIDGLIPVAVFIASYVALLIIEIMLATLLGPIDQFNEPGVNHIIYSTMIGTVLLTLFFNKATNFVLLKNIMVAFALNIIFNLTLYLLVCRFFPAHCEKQSANLSSEEIVELAFDKNCEKTTILVMLVYSIIATMLLYINGII